MEGNLRFKIDWVSLIVGRKFTVFVLFYFAFEGNFQVQAPRGLIFGGGGGGDLTEHFSRYEFGRLIFGGAYFRNFTVLRERLAEKNVHTTIPKGKMGYDQYAVPDTVAVESSVVAFF